MHSSESMKVFFWRLYKGLLMESPQRMSSCRLCVHKLEYISCHIARLPLENLKDERTRVQGAGYVKLSYSPTLHVFFQHPQPYIDSYSFKATVELPYKACKMFIVTLQLQIFCLIMVEHAVRVAEYKAASFKVLPV